MDTVIIDFQNVVCKKLLAIVDQHFFPRKTKWDVFKNDFESFDVRDLDLERLCDMLRTAKRLSWTTDFESLDKSLQLWVETRHGGKKEKNFDGLVYML